MYLKGVCCEFCRKVRTEECPVESAAPWSRWKNWCSEYQPNPDEPEAVSLESLLASWEVGKHQPYL
jgi:hypothetical protein